jgi:hypothetical protein
MITTQDYWMGRKDDYALAMTPEIARRGPA